MQTCSKCNIGTEFYIAHTGIRSSYCKSCMCERSRLYSKTHREICRAGNRKWAKEHPDKTRASIRNAYLKKNYGIRQIEYDRLYQIQQGRCGLCHIHQTELLKRFAVDHDHKTGLIRGLLCFDCNTGLGKFGDSIERLERAAAYLRGISISKF